MSTATLDGDGASAIFAGKRYERLPNFQFQIDPRFKSIDRMLTMSLHSESNDIDGIASFGSKRRIAMMGASYVDAEILVIFATLEDREHQEWHVTEEQQRRWPCRLDYEASERTGILERWRLILDIPNTEIVRITEIVTSSGVHDLTLAVHLSGLYMPEGEIFPDGRPKTDLAYLLPKEHWGGKTPKLYGYASWLVIQQRLFRKKPIG